MALAIAVAALNRERAGAGGVGEAEERRARALAAAMVAWAEGQAAQLMTTPAAADDGREVGRPPRHNFCFKCGAALHSAATFCADCGVKLPREGDTEVPAALSHLVHRTHTHTRNSRVRVSCRVVCGVRVVCRVVCAVCARVCGVCSRGVSARRG
jgi:hypothetical protein